MSKWSEFIRGAYLGPLIEINNERDFKLLQQLAAQNKLDGYEYLLQDTYEKVNHILEINYRGPISDYLKISKNRTSFCVEYRSGEYGYFTYGFSNEYDQDKQDPSDWAMITMDDIKKELNGSWLQWLILTIK